MGPVFKMTWYVHKLGVEESL